MSVFKKVLNVLAPDAQKAADGRDQWPNRASFVLAAMGGAVGLGNILRYPSVVFENNGLQWFLPYFISLIFLAIPLLILEISIGQAARGGGVIAFNTISKHARGVGIGTILTGYMVCTYYVAILAWVMIYFRHAFYTPQDWAGRGQEFYMQDVIANIAPVPGEYSDDGKSVLKYASYPGTGLVGETVGWTAFVWFVVYLCMFKGVGLSGRVVYFTMGLPIVMIFVLLGRGVSLPNAVEGIKMYVAHWDSWKLSSGQIWQAAAGQIFFSTGVGFGYFTAFASYNPTFANAVQDSIIVACSNSAYEVIGAFAVFGIVGFLGLKPEAGDKLGTFTVGFLTYPLAVSEMPASAFWGVVFFFTIMLVGLSSATLSSSPCHLICDTDWGKKVSRTIVCTIVITISFLLSLLYCTRFGFYLLDAVDTWLNNFSLLFMAFSECIAVTTLYRYKEVVGQVGRIPFLIYNIGYVVAIILGIGVGHGATPWAGAIMGFGLFIATSVIALVLAKNPDTRAPRFWANTPLLERFWWLAFYSGNQLTRDLNIVVATGKNWRIPVYWGPVLKYISAPILAIIVGFAYPMFQKLRNDPLHIFAFSIANIVMLLVVLGLVVPRSLSVLLPADRRRKVEHYAPGVTLPPVEIQTSAVEETVEETEQMKEKH
ncbi:creatine transporter [Histoplasma capsulatum H143]|uniref:Creatine transporter n=1 Tax=Ajellomyces capsulatus (strain H143) TaxID=544712 RepID=C6H573_AJECH|nr:creatine transporter [Histoplasma capsulatum H143]